MNYKLAILVVLYNKDIDDSKSIINLSKLSLSDNGNILVYIWNNGPKSTSLSDSEACKEFPNVEVHNSLSNPALSKVYNTFIEKVDSDKYIILDDDSNLNQEYIDNAISLSCCSVGMPLITNNGKICNPKINGLPIASKYLNHIVLRDIITIGSGIVIGKSIKDELIKMNVFSKVFDERFYFYGIDTAFCRCLKINGLSDRIVIISGFEHDLSRFKKESKEVKSFRRLERSYDRGLSLRYYFSLKKSLVSICKLCLSYILGLNRNLRKEIYLIHVIKAYVTGKHYRQ
ncbi:MAG: hypothetical protein ABJG42_07435 [Vibrio splendidus]